METGSTFRETLRHHEAKFGRNAKLRRELNMFLRGGDDTKVKILTPERKKKFFPADTPPATPLSYLQSLPEIIQGANEEQKETLRTIIEKFTFSGCEECKNAATIEDWNGLEFDCDKCLNDALFNLPYSAFQEKKATLIEAKEKEIKDPKEAKKAVRKEIENYCAKDGETCTVSSGESGICVKEGEDTGKCVPQQVNPIRGVSIKAAEKEEECKKAGDTCLGEWGECKEDEKGKLKCVPRKTIKSIAPATRKLQQRRRKKKEKLKQECEDLNTKLGISNDKTNDKINLCRQTFIKGDDGMKGYYPFRKLRGEGISAEDIKTHAGEFQDIDENKDGSIGLSELTAAYAAACGEDEDCKATAAAKSAHAMDGQDGNINMEDYVRWASGYATKEGE